MVAWKQFCATIIFGASVRWDTDARWHPPFTCHAQFCHAQIVTVAEPPVKYPNLTRRRVLHAGLTGALTTLAASSIVAKRSSRPPNIVFILADDLGYADLSCYGRREYETPAIDLIAARGIRFLQGYANSCVCSAT